MILADSYSSLLEQEFIDIKKIEAKIEILKKFIIFELNVLLVLLKTNITKF